MSDLASALSALQQTANQIGQVAGVASAGRIGYNSQKKLMALQNQYNIEAFERSNQRQDQLIVDSPSLIKQGLKKAGYSTADPTGEGFAGIQAGMQQEGPSVPSASFAPVPNFDVIGPYAQLKQVENMDSQTRLNEIEEQYKARMLEGEIGKINQELEQNAAKFPEILANLQKDIELKHSQKQLNEDTAKKVVREVENLSEVLRGLKVDNAFKYRHNEAELKKLGAEIYKLSADGDYSAVAAKLAKNGILLNGNGFASFLAFLSSGNSDEVKDEAVSALEGMIPEPLKGLGAGIVEKAGEALRNERYKANARAEAYRRLKREGKRQREINQYMYEHGF